VKRAASGLIALGLATIVPAAEVTTDLGERVYTTICQGCHMSSGEGAVGAGTYPKLAGNPKLVTWQYVALTVLQGRNGMPPFASKPGMSAQEARMSSSLTDEEIAAVVNYVRTHFGNDHKDKATAREVQVLPHAGQKGSAQAG
jgi:mono/diheme cytochrome c family protein